MSNDFTDNLLRSFVIHGVLCVVGIFLLVFTGGFGMLVNAIGAVVAYILLARKYLKQLPQGNLLSVSGVSILLVILFGAHHILAAENIGEILAFLNFPAIALVDVALIPVELVFGIDEFVFAESSSLVMLVAAFLPSLLMYLGLRLKIRDEEREDY